MSLVTGVLDKKFGFWSLDKNKRDHFINKLYQALVELLKRFHYDWINNNINKDRVMIVHFDRMMKDFDGLMFDIINFTGSNLTNELKDDIIQTAKKQREFQSKHKYNLEKFGLTKKQIQDDCKFIYDTFLNEN